MPPSAGIHEANPARESVASLQSRNSTWAQLSAAQPRRAQMRPMDRGRGSDLHPFHAVRFVRPVNTNEAIRALVKRTRTPNLSRAKRKPSSSGWAKYLAQ